MLLESVPPGVTTCNVPLVAPIGTWVMIAVGESTVNSEGAPLKVTLDAPVRFVPRIVTGVPILPNHGTVFTKGASPIDNRKTVPYPWDPPVRAVP